MPAATSTRRKKHNKFKKNSSLTKTNHHSSPTIQPFQESCDLKPLKEEGQGPLELEPCYVVVEHKKNNNNIKEDSFSVGAAFDSYHNSTMEEHLNGGLKGEETHQNVEESLAKEDKEEVVDVAAADDDDVSDIKDEQEIVAKEDNSEHVSDSVLDESFEHAVSSSPNDEFNDNNALASETVESEFEPKEEQQKALEDNNDPSLVLENEDSREPEVVEKDVKILEEEENVMPSNYTEDVVSSEETTLNTDIPKPDENENKVPSPIPIPATTKEEEEVAKGSEGSLVPPYESSKEESFQPLPNVPNAETTTVTVQKEIQVPNSTQNQGIVSVAPRQHTSWSSCCGIFEVLRRGGDR